MTQFKFSIAKQLSGSDSLLNANDSCFVYNYNQPDDRDIPGSVRMP